MPNIYIFGSRDRAEIILEWLSRDAAIGRGEIAAIVNYPDSPDNSVIECSGVPLMTYSSIKERLHRDDILIVASENFEETVAELLSNDFDNVFDGDLVIRQESTAQKFMRIASDLYIGPTTPPRHTTDENNYLRYTAEPLEANKIPRHELFIVNSMPKSGTIWMMAMIEAVLGVQAKRQITLSHVHDIETDWVKRNNHGTVVLVRDMRDVVVSWFHHTIRSDLQSGFTAARYPSIEEFYFDHLIGQIFGSARYYYGRFEKWLDFAGANSLPLVRYEDLLCDTQASLRKIMNFWKISVSDQALARVAQDYSFSKMQDTVANRDGYVVDMLNEGHMRKGKTGSWEDELPDSVADDINQRFYDYQRRLRYQ